MRVWMFDVDGVIVNLQTVKIEEKAILDEIAKRLSQKDIVVFISGRSVSMQQQSVVTALTKTLKKQQLSSSLLDNVYVSGEFGGTSIHFKNGIAEENIEQSFVIPKKMFQELRDISKPFLPEFVIEDKETIFTVFCRIPEVFAEKKSTLMKAYRKIVEKYKMTDVIEVHQDPSSINVKYKRATKAYATDKIISWITEKYGAVDHFYAFGDAYSDIHIGEELQKQKQSFTFVFVGNPGDIKEMDISFPIVYTTEKNDKGTKEFLEANN